MHHLIASQTQKSPQKDQLEEKMNNLTTILKDLVETKGRQSLLNQELVINNLPPTLSEGLKQSIVIVIKSGAAKKIAEWTESANYKISLVPNAITKMKIKLVAAKLLSEQESDEVIPSFFYALAPSSQTPVAAISSDSNAIGTQYKEIKGEQIPPKARSTDPEENGTGKQLDSENRRGIGLIALITSALIGVIFPPAFIISIAVLPMAISSTKFSFFVSNKISTANNYLSQRFERVGAFSGNAIMKIDNNSTNIHTQASWKLALFVIVASVMLIIYGIFSSLSKSGAATSSSPPLAGSPQTVDKPQSRISHAVYNGATNNLEITSSGGGSIFKASCSQFITPEQNKVFHTQISGDKINVYFGPHSSPVPHHKAIFSSSSFCWCGVELANT